MRIIMIDRNNKNKQQYFTYGVSVHMKTSKFNWPTPIRKINMNTIESTRLVDHWLSGSKGMMIAGFMAFTSSSQSSVYQT